jgi:hypothetical protein
MAVDEAGAGMDTLTWIRSQWDRLAAWSLISLAAVLVVGATLQARDALYAPQQFSFLMSGAIAALGVGALGSALLLSAAFHDEWRHLDGIERALRQPDPPASGAAPSGGKGTLVLWLRAERDRFAGWALVIVAFVLLLAGYRSVADSLYGSDQVAYVISSGVGALVLIFVGAAVLLFADWRDGAHKLSRIASLRVGASTSDAMSETRVARTASLGIALGLVLGVAVVALGWARAADALRAERAMDGLVIAGAGLGLIVVVLAAVAIRLRLTLRQRMTVLFSGMVSADQRPADVSERVTEIDLSELWTADGLVRFHRASCPAFVGVREGGRPVRSTDRGLEPCLICEAGE